MKTIEIRLPGLGKAVGTTGWVAPKLFIMSQTLEVGKTKSEEPCLTYRHWSDKDKDGNFKKYVLCFIMGGQNFDQYLYDNRYGNVWCIKAENENDYCSYLFPVLSQTAKEKVDEFLDEICEKFWEEYNEK